MDRIAERAGWSGKGRQRDASNVVGGRYRSLDITLVKPLTYMNDSGRSGPQGPAARARAAGRPAGRRRRLRAAVRQAAVPRGRRAGRPQRPALDHRRARAPRSSAGCGSGSASRTGPRSTTSCRASRPTSSSGSTSCSTRPRTRSRRGRARARARRPTASTCSSSGRPTRTGSPRPARSTARPAPTASAGRGPAGGRSGRPRTGRRWLSARRRRSAAGAAATGASPTRSPTDFAARHAPPIADEDAVDFDIGRGRRRGRGRPPRTRPAATARGRDARPPNRRPARRAAVAEPATGCPTCPRCRRCWPRPGRSPTLRERLGSAGRRPAPGGRHVGLVAVPHGAKTYLAAALALAATGERLVWIARDAEIGDRVAEELGAWLGDPEAVVVLEPRTALAYERSELDRRRDGRPRRGARRVAQRPGAGPRRERPGAAPAHDRRRPTCRPRRASCGAAPRLHQDALLRELFDLGYVPVTEVAGRGEFARRGGIVDVFPPSLPLPIRIEFFGDEIDSLRAFDPTDQRTVGTVERAVLLPATEFLLPAGGAAAIRDRLGRAAARLPGAARGRPRPVRHRGRWPAPTGATAMPTGASRAHGRRRRGRGLGRPPRAGDRPRPPRPGHAARPRRAGRHRRGGRVPVAPGRRAPRRARSRPASCRRTGRRPTSRRATGRAGWSASRTLELTWESEPAEDARWPAARCRRATRSAGASRSCRPAGPGAWSRPSRAGARTAPRIVLASDQAPRLADLLGEAGMPVAVVDRARARRRRPAPSRSSSAASTAASPAARTASPSSPTASCSGRSGSAGRGRSGGSCPRDILERLTPGDLVVHIDHGVARYEQMLRRGGARARSATTSSCRSRAATGSSCRSSRSAGSRATPAASGRRSRKLGGTEWLRAKQRVRKAVDDLAEELLALYAVAGRRRSGHAFAPDTPWQAEMEASFPYEETIDQLRAAAEVKADMELIRPMDRLVVGDVGYGKTEVALRAAFKATQDGVQVAVLVPTTVLAAQHHATFSQRFAAFPLEVRLLSRFVPASDAGGDHRGPRRRDGRHRHRHAPAAEQGHPVPRPRAWSWSTRSSASGWPPRSGSSSSAREVDVLTLSATPIPRTLNLALAGIRDLSVIETPPEDRLPIQTRVAEASAGLVRDAILRELDRGGQVFYVHNRVETIEAQAEQLRRMLPGVRFVVGHGQMGEGALEKVMIAFADGDRRRPGLHDDHRIGARHPERQHDHHRPRRHARARPALPAPRPRRPLVAAGLRVPPLPPPRAAVGRGAQAAPGDLQRVGAGRRLPDRAVRPRDPRRRQHPRRRAVGAHGRRRLRPLLAPAGRGGRDAQGVDGGPGADRRGAAGRHRPAGRGAPARRLRPGRGPEAGALPAARAGADRRATWPPSARRSSTATGRCPTRSSA